MRKGIQSMNYTVFIWYRSGSGSNLNPGVLMTKNLKNLQLTKNYIFLSETTIYISLGLHKGQTKNYKRSLLLLKENMKFLNFFYFCGSLLPSWIRIPNADTDPLTRLNPDPIRIRVRNPAKISVPCIYKALTLFPSKLCPWIFTQARYAIPNVPEKIHRILTYIVTFFIGVLLFCTIWKPRRLQKRNKSFVNKRATSGMSLKYKSNIIYVFYAFIVISFLQKKRMNIGADCTATM
jgi:hypothetical protein